MNSITIDCDTQAGQTIDVATGTIVTVTGTNMGLPEWFVGTVGSVPGYGAWAIECAEGVVTISNPRPTYTLSYPLGYVKVYRDECPQTITLRTGRWMINGVVYEGTYTIDGDAIAEAV